MQNWPVNNNKVYVIWLTGISGAGKTTLGQLLEEELKGNHVPVARLDGDAVREFFEHDLGYGREERINNVKRIAFAAKTLSDNGINTVVCNIAPYYEVRDFIRRKIPNYIQIYLKASLDKVMARDVKGVYKKFEQGKAKNLIGIDDGYDIPRNPDLVVDTDNYTAEESLNKILDLLSLRGICVCPESQ